MSDKGQKCFIRKLSPPPIIFQVYIFLFSVFLFCFYRFGRMGPQFVTPYPHTKRPCHRFSDVTKVRCPFSMVPNYKGGDITKAECYSWLLPSEEDKERFLRYYRYDFSNHNCVLQAKDLQVLSLSLSLSTFPWKHTRTFLI